METLVGTGVVRGNIGGVDKDGPAVFCCDNVGGTARGTDDTEVELVDKEIHSPNFRVIGIELFLSFLNLSLLLGP